MNDLPPLPDEGEVPHAVSRRPGPRTLQLVWIIPIVAALVGIGIAIRAFLEHGPTITIHFLTAQGIEAGVIDLRVTRTISDWPEQSGQKWQGQLDLAQGAGDVIIDSTPVVMGCGE